MASGSWLLVLFAGYELATSLNPMTRVYQALVLLLLLLLAQQGAVVHELSHLSVADAGHARVESKTAADGPCPLCAEFAQVVTPAFGHAFQFPHLVLATPELGPEPHRASIEASVPTPRSRGPPFSS